MAAVGAMRTASAKAVSACFALKIERARMLHVLHEEHEFSDFFMQFILTRGIRTQADLVDQLFNSSERRLARTLLLMAEFGQAGDPEPLIPPVTQETLAEMIGTTRSRVSFFMNRFRKLGYIDYNGPYSGSHVAAQHGPARFTAGGERNQASIARSPAQSCTNRQTGTVGMS